MTYGQDGAMFLALGAIAGMLLMQLIYFVGSVSIKKKRDKEWNRKLKDVKEKIESGEIDIYDL